MEPRLQEAQGLAGLGPAPSPSRALLSITQGRSQVSRVSSKGAHTVPPPYVLTSDVTFTVKHNIRGHMGESQSNTPVPSAQVNGPLLPSLAAPSQPRASLPGIAAG